MIEEPMYVHENWLASIIKILGGKSDGGSFIGGTVFLQRLYESTTHEN